jgi:hypothetical protein
MNGCLMDGKEWVCFLTKGCLLRDRWFDERLLTEYSREVKMRSISQSSLDSFYSYL